MLGFLVIAPRRRRVLRLYDDACTIIYHLCKAHPEPVEFHMLCRAARLPAERVEKVLTNLAAEPFTTSRRVRYEPGSPAEYTLDLVSLTDAGWAVFNADVWRI
jgi:hypothetical protein